VSNPWALFATRRGAAALIAFLTVGSGGAYLKSETRQAERAGVELETNLFEWSRKAGELEGSLTVARAREDWLDKECLRLEGKVLETEGHLATSQRASAELARRAARAQGEATELRGALEALRRDRDLLEERRLEQEEVLSQVRASLTRARARRLRLERQLVEAGDLVAKQRRELRDQARELALERARLEALETTLAEDQRRLAEARAQLRRSQREQRAAQAASERLRGELAQEQRAHALTRAQLTAAERETAQAGLRLRAEVKRAAAAEGTLAKLEAAGVNVERLSGARPLPALQAVVLRVDPDAVPPRVVIDAGSSQGLMQGDVLHIVRNGRSVGRVKVDEVQGRLSTARLIEGTRGLVLRPGDTIRSNVPKP
jgi:chromosome segregation ATPase